MPSGFYLILAAQFFSALADNGLLIVTIALLSEQGLPVWWAPLLKFVFTVSYVVLAPFVGPLADAFPKARLMACMNGIKIVGVCALLLGLNPLVAFAIAGLGAAAYAPAKYGLITEIVGPDHLVKANGWLETSIVCAALLGAVLGGVLVNSSVMAGLGSLPLLDTLVLHSALYPSLVALLLIYALASVLNMGIPHSGAKYPASTLHPIELMKDFWRANRLLWRDAEGGLSLGVTTIFWGLGATLQFVVLKWSADILGLPLEHAAYLQAAVAVGVVAGRIPELLAMRSLARDLTGKSSSELRAYLRSPSCLTPNCVLLALRGRGENIHCEIPVVLDLLVSENVGRRGQGWAALTSAFPELVGKIPDYRIGDSVEECRQKTEILRHAVR